MTGPLLGAVNWTVLGTALALGILEGAVRLSWWLHDGHARTPRS